MQKVGQTTVKPLFAVLAVVAVAALVALPLVARVSAQGGGGGGGAVDITGEWAGVFNEDQPERLAGPELGDYLGLPINEAARLHADTWDASRITLPEEQCMPHPSTYALRGPMNIRIWKEVDPVTQDMVAIRTHGSWMAPEREIFLDNRPHPPAYAPHTWQGFTTGQFVGGVLTTYTTHIKEGWVRRNGVHHSDQATMVEHWMRHGDHLTVMTVVTDPVYLTEPMIKTTDFRWTPGQNVGAYPCSGFEVVVEVDRPAGIVPNHLPGTNGFLKEFSQTYNIPYEATRGGAETMYPEYQDKLKTMATATQKK
jgi:hypothetical protein